MDGNTELLNYIYQNSQMGETTIDQLTEIARDKEFLDHLRIQKQEYQGINREAMGMLRATGHQEKDLGVLPRVSSYMSIGVKTMVDHSPSHIAEMMIRGSAMGIIDATKNINKYQAADPPILDLAEKLLHTEQSNVEQLKTFLS